MGKNLLSRKEIVELTGSMIEKMYPKFKSFFKHESEHGIWLPEKYEADPAKWLDILQEVNVGMEEFINNKDKIYGRYSTRDTSGDNRDEQTNG